MNEVPYVGFRGVSAPADYREKLRVQQTLEMAYQLYYAEWESAPRMTRPAQPVCTPERALADGFITKQDYDLVK